MGETFGKLFICFSTNVITKDGTLDNKSVVIIPEMIMIFQSTVESSILQSV